MKRKVDGIPQPVDWTVVSLYILILLISIAAGLFVTYVFRFLFPLVSSITLLDEVSFLPGFGTMINLGSKLIVISKSFNLLVLNVPPHGLCVEVSRRRKKFGEQLRVTQPVFEGNLGQGPFRSCLRNIVWWGIRNHDDSRILLHHSSKDYGLRLSGFSVVVVPSKLQLDNDTIVVDWKKVVPAKEYVASASHVIDTCPDIAIYHSSISVHDYNGA